MTQVEIYSRHRSAVQIKPDSALLAGAAVIVGNVLAFNSQLCWWWCWGCSCVLMFASLTGRFFRIPNDLPWYEQTLRPWFLVNLIFSGYTFLTSIFYWLDLNGWQFNVERQEIISEESLRLAASSQYFYLVAHVGFLLGLSAVIGWLPKQSFLLAKGNSAEFYIKTAVVAFIAMYVFRYIPGLSQFEVRAKGVFTVAAAVSLGLAYRTQSQVLLVAIIANLVLGAFALASGWKEEVLVLVILNSVTFYPAYPKLTTFVTAVIVALGFVVLPPIANQIREETWSNQGARFAATWEAVERVAQKPAYQLIDESWVFLAGRLSEQGLFVRYLESVPEQRPFYGTQILSQAMVTPVPRLLWPAKESTERLVHKRVVENGVVSEFSNVSAKPQYVVDGYLSFGGLGVLISAVLYGVITQLSSALCESRLGGYLFGGVMFNGLFALLWRGNCWEFFFNNVVWSIISVFLIASLGRSLGWFVPPTERMAARS